MHNWVDCRWPKLKEVQRRSDLDELLWNSPQTSHLHESPTAPNWCGSLLHSKRKEKKRKILIKSRLNAATNATEPAAPHNATQNPNSKPSLSPRSSAHSVGVPAFRGGAITMWRWKRGSSHVEDRDAPIRVYRRRSAPDANTGPDHGEARAPTDPPPPSTDRQLPLRTSSSTDPSSPNQEPPPRTPSSEGSPHHGARGGTPPPLPPQQRGSTATALTPHRRGIWRPKQESALSPAIAAGATHQAHAASPTATPPSAPARGSAPPRPPSQPAHGPRQGTPPLPASVAAANTPPHPTSPPAPPLPSSPPNRGVTPPSSGTGSPYEDLRTPSPSHMGDSSSSGAALGSGSGGSTASSSSTKSFASLFHDPRKKQADDKVRAEFFNFLNR
jgi:hypothetical protein